MAQKQEGTKIVNFRMTDEDIKRLDEIVEIEGYNDRADAVRTLIRLRHRIMEELMGNQGKKEMAEKHNRECPVALLEKEQRAIGIIRI